MSLLRPKIVGGVSLVIVLILFVSLAQEMNRRLQVQRQVQELQREVKDMERNNVELGNLNQYFRTDEYQERLAREKLNYQLPGEKVVLIQEGASAEEVAAQAKQAEAKVSIPRRWWNDFFPPLEPIEP